LAPARTIEPRLTIPLVYRPCTRTVPDGGTIPKADCGLPSPRAGASAALRDLSVRVAGRVRAETKPSALQAAALIDLIWNNGERIPLERSITYLRTASRLADRPASALTDLAAALLVRAARDQTPRDLLDAIEAADGALRLEPRNPAARFNLALALDLLGLAGEARIAWNGYLAVDSSSAWAEEARRRAGPPAEGPEPTAPGPGAPSSQITAYVREAPQQALLFGWDHALSRWATGVMADAPARAEEWLRLARELGNALVGQGGDATLADAIHAIDAVTGDSSAVRGLARAHLEYAAGRQASQAGNYSAARRSYRRAISADGASPALLAWMRISLASSLVYQGRPEAAEAAARPVIAYADTLRQPALAGMARWVIGTTLLRRGRYERAIREFRRAAALFERAGEREYVGAAEHLAADAQQYLGDPAIEYPMIHRALTTLRPYRRSIWLHGLLYFSARFAAADGFPRAAARIQDEDVRVAAATGRPIYLAEAEIARARLAAAAGDAAAAGRDLAAARDLGGSLEPGPERRWFDADLRLTEAALTAPADPARATLALDSVIAFFDAQQNVIRLLPALVARAEAAFAGGRVAAATHDLERSLALFSAAGAGTVSRDLRASLLESARHLVDRLVMLRLAAGAPDAALSDLERARVSLAPAGRSPPGLTKLRAVAPGGQVVADYALIGDTLLIWSLADTALRLTRSTLDREALVRTIERVRASLELRVDNPTTQRDLAALYDLLVRPIEPWLGGDGVPLVLVADGEIAGVPFPALRDRARGRYLVESHPLRFDVSLRDAARPPKHTPLSRPKVLLVADPAFDARVFPRLAPLPGAMAEVEAIAAQYPGARTLTGAAASRATVEAALPRTDIAHYAGHALFDDVRPDRSSLVLAPDSAAGAHGQLTAWEIERLDLRRVRLVVLSACETTRPRAGRSAGLAGLTGALLGAGAGGVLGTLWRVDDPLTLQLMAEFHRAYRQSGDAARSLRDAQVRLLRSPDATLRSPAAWAAFRYTGT